ncbi:MAG TPA: pilus assembly protein TadG-related protein, partial [Candidatus Dormibacteraeota bacterium]|nr:pilus assembly protein TadG-related protein [Candidatus Dormibacteraeota bacterium]
IALGMVAFVGFLGLAIDGGNSYLTQRSLQRAADMAALAATSSYFRSNVVSEYLPSGSVAGAFTTARNAATAVVVKDGYASSIMGTPTATALDSTGVALSNQCNATCPGASQVRGFSVSLSRTAPTNFMSALGFGQTTIAATASAMITVPGGAVQMAPLLVQSYTSSSVNLPRNSAYGASPVTKCAPNPNDGIQYPATPDCRPTVNTPVVLVQAATSAPGLSAPFNGVTQTRFYILHDPPTCGTGGGFLGSFSPCDATSGSAGSPGTVYSGESTLMTVCPPSSVGSPCTTPQYWAELNHTGFLFPADDGVANGINARITQAQGAAWSNQDCSNPGGGGGVPPLSSDNPRLMRLPVNYSASLANQANDEGQARISETVMFCAQYTSKSAPVPKSGTSYAITGYLVDVPTNVGTTVAVPGAYFGQDVLIRLLS